MTPKTGAHTVRLDDESYRVDVAEGGEVHIAGLEGGFRVAAEPDGSCLVTNGARRWRVLVAGVGERRQVFVEGEVYDIQVERAGRAKRAPARSHVETLTVPMPAKVVKVLVAPGQVVRRGDVVVKLEAMKMELPLRAPRDGTVRTLACREGDLVQPGATLLELA